MDASRRIGLAPWERLIPIPCVTNGLRLGVNIDHVATLRPKIAALPGYGPTYGNLLLNPCWDDLRSDTRFDKILATAKSAIK